MNNAQGRSDAHVSGVPVKAPPAEDELVPVTTLLDLPAALLEDVALRLAEGRETLARTCFGLFEAGLLHAPSFRLQLDRQCCDKLLSPRVVAALRARTCKLAIALEQPRVQDSRLLAEVLGKLGICIAVEACKLSSLKEPSLVFATPLDCRSLAQCLVDSFPALTSLSLDHCAIPCTGLAALLSHPQLTLQLQQLDLSSTTILQREQPEPGAATLDNLFNAARGLDGFRAALPPLAQLRELTISAKLETATWHREGLLELLQALPRLHTLQLPHATVRGQEQLDTLLAATQLTSIQLCHVEELTSSRADAPCSWQRLELTGFLDTASAAYLPLHSLTQRLVVEITEFRDEGKGGDPSLQMAAVHNLTQACKVPVRFNDLWLSLSSDRTGEEQQEQLEQWVAVLQPLKLHCSWGALYVFDLDVGGAGSRLEADISALAPFCQGCTRLSFTWGRVEPSLRFWRQLVQLMPTITEVVFENMDGSTSKDMHESLQLMAEQPWARWLDICIDTVKSDLPACWRASPLSQPGKLRVWFGSW